MKEQKEAVDCHSFGTEETTFVYDGLFLELLAVQLRLLALSSQTDKRISKDKKSTPGCRAGG
jgi:hypothetical protein